MSFWGAGSIDCGQNNRCRVEEVAFINFLMNVLLCACARGHGGCLAGHMAKGINMVCYLTSQQWKLSSFLKNFHQLVSRPQSLVLILTHCSLLRPHPPLVLPHPLFLAILESPRSPSLEMEILSLPTVIPWRVPLSLRASMNLFWLVIYTFISS